MPRAKRALAEADPNASRLLPNPKSSKTAMGTIRKTEDRGILESDKEEKSKRPKHNIVRNKSLNTGTRSLAPKLPNPTTDGEENLPASPAKVAIKTRHRFHAPGSKYSTDVDNNAANHAEGDSGGKIGAVWGTSDYTVDGNKIDYQTKDNSKLRVLLSDRCMSTSGSRQELISRLEESACDYDTYSSERLVGLLKERHLTNTALGSKAIKIQRLLLNDSLDRDTSNYEDMKLYVRTDVCRYILDDLVAKQEARLAGEDLSYSTSVWTVRKVQALLKDRKLPCSGTKGDMVARLRLYDQEKLAEDISKARDELLSSKERLEAQVGHPIEDTDLMEKENRVDVLDRQLQSKGQASRLGIPVCDYNWRESHWASRTERELWDICQRRGMPGHGPKPTLIKWLDTGSVEYEDLYACSLEIMCFKRGIKHKSGEKKVDLVRLLKEDDEQEGAN